MECDGCCYRDEAGKSVCVAEINITSIADRKRVIKTVVELCGPDAVYVLYTFLYSNFLQVQNAHLRDGNLILVNVAKFSRLPCIVACDVLN